MVFITFYIIFVLWLILTYFNYIINIKMASKNKTLLFDDDSASDRGSDKDKLGLNENFASKYEHN